MFRQASVERIVSSSYGSNSMRECGYLQHRLQSPPMFRDDAILSRFPKQRPLLPDAYRRIYAEHYRRNREGESPASSLSQKMESWMHRKVAADVAGMAAG